MAADKNLERPALPPLPQDHLVEIRIIEKHDIEPEVVAQVGVAGLPPISTNIVQ